MHKQYFIIGNSSYKTFYTTNFQVIPNCLIKIVFAIPAERASQTGNIGSIVVLDVDVVGLMDEKD